MENAGFNPFAGLVIPVPMDVCSVETPAPTDGVFHAPDQGQTASKGKPRKPRQRKPKTSSVPLPPGAETSVTSSNIFSGFVIPVVLETSPSPPLMTVKEEPGTEGGDMDFMQSFADAMECTPTGNVTKSEETSTPETATSMHQSTIKSQPQQVPEGPPPRSSYRLPRMEDIITDWDELEHEDAEDKKFWTEMDETLQRMGAASELIKRVQEGPREEKARLMQAPLAIITETVTRFQNAFAQIKERYELRSRNTVTIVQRAMAVIQGGQLASISDLLDGDERYEIDFTNDALLPSDTTERLNLSSFDLC